MRGFIRHLPTSGPAALLGIASAIVLSSCGALPTDETLSFRQAPIIGGQVSSDYPAVGRLFAGVPGGMGSLCTATLIGKKTVLTAAHCIVPGEPHNFITDANQFYQAAKVVQHGGWDPTNQDYPNDIAVVLLEQAPPLTPMLIGEKAPSVGLALTLVGFGETSEGKRDTGIKRVGKNSIKEVAATRFAFVGAGGGIGNTCKGDSGGPAFATVDNKLVQVGVTSAGYKPCGTKAFDTRVDAYRSWIIATAGGDVYQPDATKPQVSILSPADQATVQPSFTLRISASDAGGIAQVQVKVDGQLAGTKSQAPYDFNMTNLAAGRHTLVALATDIDGNQASAQIIITVKASASGGQFGDVCKDHLECISQICASAGDRSYCTQTCTGPGAGDCPDGAPCVDAGGVFVCGPPVTTNNTTGAGGRELLGGCAVSSGAFGAEAFDAVLLTLGLLGLLIRRRRPPRVQPVPVRPAGPSRCPRLPCRMRSAIRSRCRAGAGRSALPAPSRSPSG